MAFYTRGVSGYLEAVSNHIPRWLVSFWTWCFPSPSQHAEQCAVGSWYTERKETCRQQNEDEEGLAEGGREAGKKGQGLQTFVLLKGSNIPEEAVPTPGVWEKRNMTCLPSPKFVLQACQRLRIDHSRYILPRLSFYGYSLRRYLFSNERQVEVTEPTSVKLCVKPVLQFQCS